MRTVYFIGVNALSAISPISLFFICAAIVYPPRIAWSDWGVFIIKLAFPLFLIEASWFNPCAGISFGRFLRRVWSASHLVVDVVVADWNSGPSAVQSVFNWQTRLSVLPGSIGQLIVAPLSRIWLCRGSMALCLFWVLMGRSQVRCRQGTYLDAVWVNCWRSLHVITCAKAPCTWGFYSSRAMRLLLLLSDCSECCEYAEGDNNWPWCNKKCVNIFSSEDAWS